MDTLFILLQHLLPQHLLSRLTGKLAQCKIRWLKNFLITRFISHFGVDMREAVQEQAESYDCFNSFFTRPLKPGLRPQPDGPLAIVSPADGSISAIGNIDAESVFQAKGKQFSLTALLGGDADVAAHFHNGSFATIYLSPKDYHRVHMPCTGILRETIYIPGKLFSVNATTARHVDALFARNERVVCLFDSDAGPMAVILVGALIVAGIETVWGGLLAPASQRHIQRWPANVENRITLRRGDELGRFRLGSTAIVLFGEQRVNWAGELHADSSIRMGATMGSIT